MSRRTILSSTLGCGYAVVHTRIRTYGNLGQSSSWEVCNRMAGNLGKILVVEDDEAMRLVLEERLQDWGYEVLTASDGERGKQLAESQDPDLVLSDVVMPELGGVELLRALKTGNPGRPVVLMTAQGSVDVAVEAMKAGAADFLTKPLEYPKLKAVLDAVTQDLHELQESQRISEQ